MRIPYGRSGTVNLFAADIDPPQKVQIVLRPELFTTPPIRRSDTIRHLRSMDGASLTAGNRITEREVV